VKKAGVENQIRITSAGLHASPGREAHPWAQEASSELGISLADHRAKPLTREMVERADCVLAMDFQNKAELQTLYPEAQQKIFMLSAYAEGPWKYREIPDPYLGDLEATRFCARQLQICVRNLTISIFPNR
jgi:protein-tyrosine phosphatase